MSVFVFREMKNLVLTEDPSMYRIMLVVEN